MNHWLAIVGGWLMDFALIATALLVVAIATRIVLRDPASRVLLAWGTWLSLLGMGLMLVVPGLPRYELAQFLRPRTEPPTIVTIAETDPARPEPVIVIEPLAFAGQPGVTAGARQPSLIVQWPQVAAVVWLAAALIAGGWMAIGWFQAWRLLRASKPAPPWVVEELKDVVTAALPDVRMSQQLNSAVALSALCPRIVLPAEGIAQSNAKLVRAALAHEWAHIQHGDLWLLAIERLLLPLLALHPLFWWLRGATRLDQELLADAEAAGDKPVEYAEALVAWAKTPAGVTIGLAALAMSERTSNLSRRIKMILNSERRVSSLLGRASGLLTAAMLLVLAVGLSLITLHPVIADQEPVEPPAAPASDVTTPLPAAPGLANPAALPAAPALAAPPALPASVLDPAAPAAPASTSAPAPATRSTTQERPVITLTVTLMVRDFDRVTWSQIRSIGDLERVDYKVGGGTERHVLKAEVDEAKAHSMIEKLEAMDGLSTLCRSKIIAFSGQKAEVVVSEQGPRVEIEPGDDNALTLRANQSQDIQHIVTVTPRTTSDPSRIELTVFGGRLKLEAGVGKTLLIVSTASNEVLFISPTKVERQRVRTTATIPQTPLARAAEPTSTPITQNWAPQYLAPATTALPAVPVVPVIPGKAPATAAIPPTGAVPTTPTIPPPPVGSAAPYAVNPQAVPPPVRANAATEPTILPNPDRQTTRKLLELDLAAARLEVEAAQLELEEVDSLRKRTPSAVSDQEFRKRRLQVERAKIQVKRIEVQLEAGKSAEPAATPASTPKPSAR